MSPEQIQRLREMAERSAEVARRNAAGSLHSDKEGNNQMAYIEAAIAANAAMDASALLAAADIADAYRWRLVEELTEEDKANRNRLVFAIRHPCGTMDTADSWRCRGGAGYTHFMRLPNLEAR